MKDKNTMKKQRSRTVDGYKLSVDQINDMRYKSTVIKAFDNKCCSCGDIREVELEFHHIHAKNKVATISELMYVKKDWNWVTPLFRELKKVVLVCKKCHGMIHEDKMTIPKAGCFFNPSKLGKPVPQPQKEIKMDIQIFKNELGNVRIVMKDGMPWFMAKDVCDALGLSNSRKATGQLDESEKDVTTSYTLGGNQKVTILSESGLYSLVFQSRKKHAKKFKLWITNEVLPKIRQTGAYIPEGALVIDPSKNQPEILKLAFEQAEKIQALEQKAEEAKPKVEFFDQVGAKDELFTIQEIAPHFDLGRNQMIRYLKDRKLLQQNGLPYREYIPKYFRIKISDQNGRKRSSSLCTAEGLKWLIARDKKEAEKEEKELMQTYGE
jgi:prophage antirepressor-like protein